jgi:hypothetical protein
MLLELHCSSACLKAVCDPEQGHKSSGVWEQSCICLDLGLGPRASVPQRPRGGAQSLLNLGMLCSWLAPEGDFPEPSGSVLSGVFLPGPGTPLEEVSQVASLPVPLG